LYFSDDNQIRKIQDGGKRLRPILDKNYWKYYIAVPAYLIGENRPWSELNMLGALMSNNFCRIWNSRHYKLNIQVMPVEGSGVQSSEGVNWQPIPREEQESCT